MEAGYAELIALYTDLAVRVIGLQGYARRVSEERE
jgi:hypothetical protein